MFSNEAGSWEQKVPPAPDPAPPQAGKADPEAARMGDAGCGG